MLADASYYQCVCVSSMEMICVTHGQSGDDLFDTRT